MPIEMPKKPTTNFYALVFLPLLTITCHHTSTSFQLQPLVGHTSRWNTRVSVHDEFLLHYRNNANNNNNNNNNNNKNNKNNNNNRFKLFLRKQDFDSSDMSIAQIEQDVIASANAKVDMARVKNAIYNDLNNQDNQPPPSQWRVALASGSMIGLFSFVLFHQPIVSAGFFLISAYIASKDPQYENDGLMAGDEISGPITRIVGRATIQSIERSKPKVKAVARAAIFGEDEIGYLRQRVEELEIENEEMNDWIERRRYIDDNAKHYSLDTLRDIARQYDISVDGNKLQLMMRLMDADILKL